MKTFYQGKRTEEVAAGLPPGVISHGEKWVESERLSPVEGGSTCFIRGKFDTVVEFDDGCYGVIDFKTSETKGEHVPLYSRQLHAYAFSLEQAAPGKLSLSPITTLGLLCVEPSEMIIDPDDRAAYCGEVIWIECPRDDEAFIGFLSDVVTLLDSPEPPGGDPSCMWCQYRDTVRRTQL